MAQVFDSATCFAKLSHINAECRWLIDFFKIQISCKSANMLVRSLIFAIVIAGLMTCAASSSYAQFGAIAYSPSDGVVGASYGSASRMDAESLALHDCRKSGGRECRVVAWEHRSCAVLAVGKNNVFGVSAVGWTSELRSHANDEAVESCSKSTTECKVMHSVCDG